MKIIAPPEITMAQTQDELDKITRAYYDRHSKTKPVLEFTGEWRPQFDVDNFVWVIGVNDLGQRVSYGAFRIEMMDIEGEHDPSTIDMRWNWKCNYTLIYVGIATDANTPMFTSILP